MVSTSRIAGRRVPPVWKFGGLKYESTTANTATTATAAKTITTKAVDPNILDLRVGLIKEIRRHENADSLYVSQIQVGPTGDETSVLQVCSGLVGLVPMEKLHGRRVVIVNNLKPSKMRGVLSQAMLLCADGEAVVDGESKPNIEPVSPPQDAPLGSILEFLAEGNTSAGNKEPKKRIKTKAFQAISKDLKVDNELRIVWQQEYVLCHDTIPSCCTVGDPSLVGAQVR